MLALAEWFLGPLSLEEKIDILNHRMTETSDVLDWLTGDLAEHVLDKKDQLKVDDMVNEEKNNNNLADDIHALRAAIRERDSAGGGGGGGEGTESQTKRARQYPPLQTFDENVTAEDLNEYLPPGCKFGKSPLDQAWRLSCYGRRYSRSWRLHGYHAAAVQLINKAWEVHLKRGRKDDENPYPELPRTVLT